MGKRFSRRFEAYNEDLLQKKVNQYAYDNDLNVVYATGTKSVKTEVIFEHSLRKKIKRKFFNENN